MGISGIQNVATMYGDPGVLYYSGKFSREKTFANFAILTAARKVFSSNLRKFPAIVLVGNGRHQTARDQSKYQSTVQGPGFALTPA